ncbi:hypothetical protein U1Q18_020865 [Sarracenia purpurea var. burkii]
MAQQEEGWPLGLQPLNLRVGLARNRGFFGSASFNTLLSGSASSTDSSSDLDTESTGSFFHDKSISLGSLMGVSSIVDLPRRSIRGRSLRRHHEVSGGFKKRCSSKTWCFSLCPRDNTDADQNNNNTSSSSLGHFLAVERRAAANNEHRRSYSPLIYGPDYDDELALAQPDSEPNSLFVDGHVAPPASSPWFGSDFETRRNREEDRGGFGSPLLLSCICGRTIL